MSPSRVGLCCSRVASVSTNPRLPSVSVVLRQAVPASAATNCRAMQSLPRTARHSSGVIRSSALPWPQCLLPQVASSPRQVKCLPQSQRPVGHQTPCAASAIPDNVSNTPRKFGDCTTTAATSSFNALLIAAYVHCSVFRVADLLHMQPGIFCISPQHFAIFRMHRPRHQYPASPGQPFLPSAPLPWSPSLRHTSKAFATSWPVNWHINV